MLQRCDLFALLMLVGAFISANPAWCQTTIAGVVTDANGLALGGANIEVVSLRLGQPRGGDVTDYEGRFEIHISTTGMYRVKASFVGYADSTATLMLTQFSDTVTIDFALRPVALQQRELTIVASRSLPGRSPVTTSELTEGDIWQLPALQDTPMHLSTRPSMDSYTESGNGLGYTYVSLRGFDQRRIAVSINGIAQNDPETFDVFWINFFDLSSTTKDIQIQRGASGAVYGSSGIGGAINLVTDPFEARPSMTIEGGLGSYASRKVSVQANSGLIGNQLILFARGSRVVSDGYRDWSWSRFWRFQGGVKWFNESTTLSLLAFAGRQNDALTYVGISKTSNDVIPTATSDGSMETRRSNYSEFAGEIERFHQPRFELRHEQALSDKITLDQTAYVITGEGNFDFDASFRSANYLRLPDGFVSGPDRDLPLFAARTDVTSESVYFRAYLDQWRIGWQPKLLITGRQSANTTLGIDATLHRSLRWGRVESSDIIPDAFVGDSDYRVYSIKGEKAVASMFGSHRRSVGLDVILQGDVLVTLRQYRVFDEDFFGTSFTTSYASVNPRLGVTVFPERPLTHYASVAFATREPRLKSLYDGEEAGAGATPMFAPTSDGSFDYSKPLVRPEKLFNIEGGTTWKSAKAKVAVTAYLMAFKDEIIPSGGLDQFGIPRTGNAERTRHVGLEMESTFALAPSLELYSSLAFSKNTFVEFTEYQSDGAPVDRSGNNVAGFPEQTAFASLRYTRRGVEASVGVNHSGGYPVDNSTSGDEDATDPALNLDSYWFANASFRYQPENVNELRGLELFLDINNVTNRRVLLAGNIGFGAPQFYPLAERNFFAGVRYTVQ